MSRRTKIIETFKQQPKLELLILEKNFTYKTKKEAVNFDTPHFNNLFKLMDANNNKQIPETNATQSVGSQRWSMSTPKMLHLLNKYK